MTDLAAAVDAPGTLAGVGVDVVSVADFAAQLAEPGTRFADAFTAGERRAARARATTTGGEAQHLAARWAAKEALLKAWGNARFGRPDDLDRAAVRLTEIEVRSDALGRTALRLHGAVAAALAGLVAHVSLSHDPAADVAIAYVVLTQEVPS